jgi:hypothetical protein
MKLYVDTTAKNITVSKDRWGRGHRRHYSRERPNVRVGQLVTVSSLEALLWAINERNGVALRGPLSACRGIHLHDLRHTGNQLTANAGANLKKPTAKMGHNSERAALIYLHSTAARQRALSDLT